METACLRIKFTPLLQEAKKSSEKCCLEIVPEVSCIQNLDKLTWNQESNFIEYSIPMTYKIILMKRHNKDTSDEIIKTYHSCVDLPLSSSKSNVDLASGDLSRIISDTFILNKISNMMLKKEDINITPLDDKLYKIFQSAMPTEGIILDITKPIDKETEKEVISDDVIMSSDIQTKDKQTQPYNLIADTILCDKPTSTENVLSVLPDNTNSKTPVNNSRELRSKPKSSLSPICSINTENTDYLPLTNTASKAVTCTIYDSQKDLGSLRYIRIFNEFINENKIPNIISQVGTLSGQNSMKCLQHSHIDRSPPEIRIAQYVHYMEKELKPINITLDELISKCIVLGVCKVPPKILNSTNNNLVIYKPVCMYNNHIKTETREKSIPNRAVYSIVFDG